MLNKDKAKKSDFSNYNNYLASNQKDNPIKKSVEQKNKKKSAPKNSNNLEKITGSGDINIAGSQPIVMFKKTSNKKVSKSPNPLNTKYTINKTKFEYISDGGMSQKIQKYNSNTNLNINNNNKNLYYYNNYISEKDHSSNNNNKNKKNIEKNNNINKQKKQILSKTLKDFNKRPLMVNNKEKEKEKEIINKTKNSTDERKIRQKMINKNIVKNNKIFNNNKTNEDSKEQEEEKLIRMKQLVQNGVVNEIKKLENKKKIKKKDTKIERKIEVLENQGLPMNYFNEENQKEEEKKSESYINNNLNFNKQIMSKSTRGFYPKMNNYFFPLEKNNNEENNTNQIKEKKKPSVNQFEFINKINSEKKKLNINEIYNQNIQMHHSSNLLNKRKQKPLNMKLNDSFRHKNIKKTKNVDINNINNNHNNIKIKHKSFKGEINSKNKEDLNDEFPFAHKTNHRTPEELKDFLKEKRLKLKKKEEDILLEKHKKLFVLYKNLVSLNMKDFSKPIQSKSEDHFYSITPSVTKSPSARSKQISNKNNINLIKNESNNSEENLRKKKKKMNIL